MERRLKRGLKDLSPIFNSIAEPDRTLMPSVFKSCEENTHPFMYFSELGKHSIREEFYSSLLEECHKRNFSSKVISVKNDGEKTNENRDYFPSVIPKQSISWGELREGKNRPIQGISKSEESKSLTIFDVQSQKMEALPDFITLIDQWIFAVEPEIESLTEVYRMIKATRLLNDRIQYYLLFKANVEDSGTIFLKHQMNRLLGKYFQTEMLDLGLWGNNEAFVQLQWQEFFNFSQISKTDRMSQKGSFLYYLEHCHSLEQRAI